MSDLYGTRVLVMGLGVHGGGLGVARWLLRQGARVTVTDMAHHAALAHSLAALHETEVATGTAVRYVLGAHHEEDFRNHELLVTNPAVRPDSPWIALARAAGVRIETEMTLFFRRCLGPILGVTGTKGKTTTALLLGAMLRQVFPATVVAGNLRVSALEALAQIDAQTPVVLELSSFQLGGLGEAALSPQWSLITNLSPDHINYHGSLHAYIEAKRQIVAHQQPGGVVVLPPELRTGPLGWAGSPPFIPATAEVLTVAVDHAAADCVCDADGQVHCRDTFLFREADVQLPGRHNLANALAAATLAFRFGIPAAAIVQALHAIRGVEHRQELIRILDGVRYINDTTATNPAAATVALTAVEPPIILLAGGADKQLEFAPLAEAIATRVRVLILLEGSATPRLQAALTTARAENPTVEAPRISGPFSDFAAAIAYARSIAQPGDVILLSPGCASFGMFQNEFHRGDEFRRIVSALA